MATRASFLTTRFGGYYHRDVPQKMPSSRMWAWRPPAANIYGASGSPSALPTNCAIAPTGGHPGGRSRGVPRFSRCRGTTGVALSPSGDLVGVWSDLRARDTVLLPRLALRRGRHHPRDPGRAGHSTLKDRLCHGAYPTHEYNGIVFAYMGPPDEQPPFPIYDSFSRPGYRLIPGRKYYYPCNWLQILENAMDPVHTAFLHTIVSGSQFTDEFGKVPELDFTETPVGMIYIATRRVGDNIWARMVENVLPNLQQVAPIWEDGRQEHPFSGPMMSRWIVPKDDTHTMFIEFRHVSETEGVTPAWWADRDVMLPGQVAADSLRGESAPARRLRSPGQAAADRHPRSGAPGSHGSRGHHVPATDPPGHSRGPGGADPDGLCREPGQSSRPTATTRSCAFLPRRLRRRIEN